MILSKYQVDWILIASNSFVPLWHAQSRETKEHLKRFCNVHNDQLIYFFSLMGGNLIYEKMHRLTWEKNNLQRLIKWRTFKKRKAFFCKMKHMCWFLYEITAMALLLRMRSSILSLPLQKALKLEKILWHVCEYPHFYWYNQ